MVKAGNIGWKNYRRFKLRSIREKVMGLFTLFADGTPLFRTVSAVFSDVIDRFEFFMRSRGVLLNCRKGLAFVDAGFLFGCLRCLCRRGCSGGFVASERKIWG